MAGRFYSIELFLVLLPYELVYYAETFNVQLCRVVHVGVQL